MMSEWKPIEAAPKDGTPILLASAHPIGTKDPSMCSWWSAERCAEENGGDPDDYQEGWYLESNPGDAFYHPTHWMPGWPELPPLPLTHREKKGA